MDGFGNNLRRLFLMALRLFVINWFGSRLLVNLGVVFSRGMMLLLRLVPFFCSLLLVCPVLLDMRRRLVIDGLFIHRLRSAGLLMGMNFGGNRLGLFYMGLGMRFRSSMLLLGRFGSDLLMHRRRFRDWLIDGRQGFGMLCLDLDDRNFQLVQLAA